MTISSGPHARAPHHRATVIKWAASVLQILGYATTALGLDPLNIYLFLAGLVGWLCVGVIWRDRAIMLVHVLALAAMLGSLASKG